MGLAFAFVLCACNLPGTAANQPATMRRLGGKVKAEPIPVMLTIDGADDKVHAIVVTDESRYRAITGTNLTCDSLTFQRLINDWNGRFSGVIVASWGFMECVVEQGLEGIQFCANSFDQDEELEQQQQFDIYVAPEASCCSSNARALARPILRSSGPATTATHTTDLNAFAFIALGWQVDYRVCGFSFYNEFFGESASVTITHGDSGETLGQWDSSDHWTSRLNPLGGVFSQMMSSSSMSMSMSMGSMSMSMSMGSMSMSMSSSSSYMSYSSPSPTPMYYRRLQEEAPTPTNRRSKQDRSFAHRKAALAAKEASEAKRLRRRLAGEPPAPPSADIFEVGSIYIVPVDCSAVDHDVGDVSYCSTLNRHACKTVANTCGPCFECFNPIYGNVSGPSNQPCEAVAGEARIAAPLLQAHGDPNQIGVAGASATTVRIKWEKPDCDPVVRYRIVLREAGGDQMVVYEGHPGGGFSTDDELIVTNTPPANPSSTANYTSIAVSVDLLSQGGLYFDVENGGDGISTAPTLSISGWPLDQTDANGTKSPELQVVLKDSQIDEVLIACGVSELKGVATSRGCARTMAYGLSGTFEYTQGSLAYNTSYGFSIDAQRVNGSWRGLGDETFISTTMGEAASAASSDPACGAEGLQLTATSGVISKFLKRSIIPSDCMWKLAPTGLDDGVARRIHIHFEPHTDFADDVAFSVGSEIFSPVPAEALQMHLGVSDEMFTSSGTFTELRVSNGISNLILVSPGSGCSEGAHTLEFMPSDGGATATATVDSDGEFTLDLLTPLPRP